MTGPDACRFLERVCANGMDRPPGRAIYTAMLNERGGFESDLTAIRIAEDRYRLFVGTAAARRDMAWLKRHLRDSEDVALADRSADYAVIGLMGPRSAEIAAALGAHALNATGYFRSCEAGIAGCRVRAVRLSYVGEAGWEIACRAEAAEPVYDAIRRCGAVPAGMFAQTSMRIEKRFLAYGHELDTDISPLEAGLAFAVDWGKDFIGRAALLEKRERGAGNRIVSIVLDDGRAVPLGGEPVVAGGKIVGKTTSAAFGFRIGAPIALADIAEPAARKEGAGVGDRGHAVCRLFVRREHRGHAVRRLPAASGAPAPRNFDPEGDRMRPRL